MAISYNKLWKLLIDKNMTKTDLRNITKMNSATLASMGKNKFISLKTMDKICEKLNCNFGDIIEYISEEKKERVENDTK